MRKAPASLPDESRPLRLAAQGSDINDAAVLGMILTCPNCDAKFNVKAELLGPAGRTVKCTKCGHRWHAEGEAPTSTIEPSTIQPLPGIPPPPAPEPFVAKPREAALGRVPPAPPPDDRIAPTDAQDRTRPPQDFLDAPPIPPESRFERLPPPNESSTLKYWILLFVLIAGVVAGAILLRKDIVAFYPPANKLFMTLGLPADTLGHGLAILKPDTAQRIEGDQRVLEVSGKIENTSGDVIDTPLLRAALLDTKGNELASWTFKAAQPRILPGEKIDYRTEIANPPRGGLAISVR